MSTLRLAVKVVRALWRSGLLRFPLRALPQLLVAWWRCGSSYAGLAAIAAARFRDRVAIHDEAGQLSFGALFAEAEVLARELRDELELVAGERAALVCRNHRGFVVALIALSRLGLDVLLVGSETPALAMARLLEQHPVEVIVHDAELERELERAAPTRRRWSLARSPRNGLRAALPRVRRPGHLVVLTSGSSGAAKGIRRRPSLPSLLPTVAGLLDALPLRLHRPAVLAIPLHHGYGLATLAMTLAMGAPLHTARRFEIEPLLAQLDSQAGAVLVSIPTLLQRWLLSPRRAGASCLAAVVTGSAPLEPALCRKLLEAAGPIVFNLYGSTEAGIIALARPSDCEVAPGTVGRALPGNEVRVGDVPTSSPVHGALGRVWVRGPLVLRAGSDGWLDTGDLGRLDLDGRLFICGRSDAMFISGGENVYPEETEVELRAHPDVQDAAVTVVPDQDFGQRMIAWVVPREGALDVPALVAWLRERIERHKLPRQLQAVEAIPRNALGKIDRAALAALAPREHFVPQAVKARAQ